LALLVAGCASVDEKLLPLIDLQQLKRESVSLDGKSVRLFGYVGRPMSGAYLFPSEASGRAGVALDGVDVVTKSGSLNLQRRLEQGGCAVITGIFIAFDDDTVGTGYLRSNIGMIEEADVAFEKCR
jgi:hypothetical protein